MHFPDKGWVSCSTNTNATVLNIKIDLKTLLNSLSMFPDDVFLIAEYRNRGSMENNIFCLVYHYEYRVLNDKI